MAINYIQFSAASATDGVLVAADTMDVGTATGVEVQLIKFGYGTDEVYNNVATGQGLPIATGAIYPVEQSSSATVPVDVKTWSATAKVSVIGSTTATLPVSIASTVPVSVATEVKLATDNVVDVSVATTATHAVQVQNTATVAVTNATATSLNAIVRLAVPRGNTSYAFNSVTGTDSTTLVTATANAYKDLTSIHVVNGGTANLGIIIKDTATATVWHHELAGDGGGFTLSFPHPIPQSQQATNWVFELDADTSASNPVSVFAGFITVT